MRSDGSVVTEVPLSSLEAIPLAAALVADRARVAGVRALVIKGLVVEHHGLRPKRGYADVDVIVDPYGMDAFVDALIQAGWKERQRLWVADRLDAHSATLINEKWPCDIDVHARFPGFLAPDAAVFEVLWKHRFNLEVAHTMIMGTDEVASTAVLALHALRKPTAARNRNEYEFLVAEIKRRPGLVNRLTGFARATGSQDTLAPLFDDLGIRRDESSTTVTRALRAWRRRTTARSRAGQWITYMIGVPWYRWPGELRVIIWPPRELYLQEHPELSAKPGRLFVERSRRVGAGLNDLRRLVVSRFVGR